MEARKGQEYGERVEDSKQAADGPPPPQTSGTPAGGGAGGGGPSKAGAKKGITWATRTRSTEASRRTSERVGGLVEPVATRLAQWSKPPTSPTNRGPAQEPTSDKVELYVVYHAAEEEAAAADGEAEGTPRNGLGRYVVARSEETGALRSAEYACELLSCVERVDEAVENAVVADRQHTSEKSRRADVLAGMAPSKLRRVAELAASVSRQDPSALVDILRKDPFEKALQEAYDVVARTAGHARQWLSHTPLKRAYARSFSSMQRSLASKYVEILEEAFKECEEVLRGLDALRGRLPRIARLVRFASRTDIWHRQLSSRGHSLSPVHSFSSTEQGDDDLAQSKYAADRVDDFLTDAAPLGVGVDSSEIFACRDLDGSLFLTSNYRVADDLLRRDDAVPLRDGEDVTPPLSPEPPGLLDRRSESDAAALADVPPPALERYSDVTHAAANWKLQQQGPAVLATTTIYKAIDDTHKIALDPGDQIWAVTIDQRDYYFCVMEDDSDRGLRHALALAGVDDDACAQNSIIFTKLH